MTSQLYIFEGIPGSGKTTTAAWWADFLKTQGKETELYLEGNSEHPADYESVACLTQQQLMELEFEFPSISSLAIQRQSWFFIPYASFAENYPELHQALQKFDVYELSVEDFCEVLIMRWERFVQQAQSEDKVYVMECCFLQNPITFLLAKHGISEEFIFEYIEYIADKIAILNPVIIYFEQDHIEESLDRVRKERSTEWFEFLTWYYTEQAYGQTQGLQGESGVIQFLEERKKLEKECLANLSIKNLIITNNHFDWETCKEKIIWGLT